MYCVECGKEGKLFNGLCCDCFKNKTEFFKLPRVIKINLCSLCYARQKANHWEESSSTEDGVREAIIEKIEMINGITEPKFNVDVKSKKTNILEATINIESIYQYLVLKNNLTTEVRVNYKLCPRCSKQAGSYFEAIVQVRGKKRELDEKELETAKDIVRNVIMSKDQSEENAFLTKSEYIHGGLDFYLGSNVIARQISKKMAKKFSGVIKESSSLIGRKGGRDLYRTTYIVRIPEYKLKDFIKLDNEIYQIISISQKKVGCILLKTGRIHSMKPSDLDKTSILGGSELIHEAVVVFESSKEVQILDPDNFRTVELVKPNNYKVNGETVKIFKNLYTILLIPNLI